MEHLKEFCIIALNSYNGTYGEEYERLWTGTISHETVSVLRRGDIFYVAITGSNDKFDWIRNFWAVKKNVGKGVRVHRGFHNGFKRIKNQIKRVLGEHSPQEVIFIGHSRGGAIAQVAAWFFSDKYNVSCYSFASPRVGNKAFKKHLDLKVPVNIRVAIDSDVAPKVPNINYFHAGTLIRLPKQKGLFKSHSIATHYRLLSQIY